MRAIDIWRWRDAIPVACAMNGRPIEVSGLGSPAWRAPTGGVGSSKEVLGSIWDRLQAGLLRCLGLSGDRPHSGLLQGMRGLRPDTEGVMALASRTTLQVSAPSSSCSPAAMPISSRSSPSTKLPTRA